MREQEKILASQLRAFRQRIQKLLALRMLLYGAMAAAIVALLLILIDYCTVWYVTLPLLGGLFAVGMLAGAVIGYLRPLDELAVAITVDQRLGLQERASTALALARDETGHPEFRALVINDAMTHLSGYRPQDVFPPRIDRECKMVCGLWVAVSLAFLLPSLPIWYTASARADRANMQATGKQLAAVAKQVKKDPALHSDASMRRLAQQFEKLGQELQHNRLPKKEALKRLNKLTDEVAKAHKEIAERSFTVRDEDLQKAAAAFQDVMALRSQAERDAAQRAREKLAAGKSRDQLTPAERAALEREEQLQQIARQLAAGQLDQATESLRQFGHTLNSAELSPEERQALDDAMQQMANATQSDKEIAQQFQRAANGLRQPSAAGQQQAASALKDMPTVVALCEATAQMQNMTCEAKQQLAGSLALAEGGAPGEGGMPANGGGEQAGNSQGTVQGDGGNGNTSQTGQDEGISGGVTDIRGGGGPGTGPGSSQHLNGTPAASGPIGTALYKENGQIDAEKRALSIETNAHGVAGGGGEQSAVPYYEVYEEYRHRAETAITSDQVPASERRRVKEYFGALDPNAGP